MYMSLSSARDSKRSEVSKSDISRRDCMTMHESAPPSGSELPEPWGGVGTSDI